jgi:predicted molibdopterin-dependent oxidoreductase YjgC
VILLRSVGVDANLLLPRTMANSAGVEVSGADPAFAAGRLPSPEGLPGARTHRDLRRLLSEGEIRAALVIGEDPMDWGKSGAWFQNVEFLAVMDWTPTETTAYADVVLPGSTYLESGGTRCSFEGKLVRFTQAVQPPAGNTGIEVLTGLADDFGIGLSDDLTGEIAGLVEKNLPETAPFYWNTGEERKSGPAPSLIPVEARVETVSIQSPLTHGEKYKKEIREVGTERFRVRS